MKGNLKSDKVASPCKNNPVEKDREYILVLKNFQDKIIAQSVELDGSYRKIIEKNFWDLI